jgi:hypothetical protein
LYADPSTYHPVLEITNNIDSQERIYRKHLRVKIVNRGKGIATDCKAKFRITQWNQGVRHPSTNSKTRVWDNNVILKEIYPHGEEEVLNIIFADSDLPIS